MATSFVGALYFFEVKVNLTQMLSILGIDNLKASMLSIYGI